MNQDAASLDRVYDLVLPPEIPWWPLAPGWYALLLVVLVLVLLLGYRAWKNWRSNAYRRAAERELHTAVDVATIAAVLRRTALATTPRQLIASMNGDQWVRWLSDQSPDPVPERIARLIVRGPYRKEIEDSDLHEFRKFACRWVKNHQRTSTK